MGEELTNREKHLNKQLREINQQIFHLQSRRSQIQSELNRIQPLTHQEAVSRVPKFDSTILSIFNYRALGYKATILTTPLGERELEKQTLIDQAILALCLSTPKNAEKVVALPELKAIFHRPQARAHRLIRLNYLSIKFEKVEIKI